MGLAVKGPWDEWITNHDASVAVQPRALPLHHDRDHDGLFARSFQCRVMTCHVVHHKRNRHPRMAKKAKTSKGNHWLT